MNDRPEGGMISSRRTPQTGCRRNFGPFWSLKYVGGLSARTQQKVTAAARIASRTCPEEQSEQNQLEPETPPRLEQNPHLWQRVTRRSRVASVANDNDVTLHGKPSRGCSIWSSPMKRFACDPLRFGSHFAGGSNGPAYWALAHRLDVKGSSV